MNQTIYTFGYTGQKIDRLIGLSKSLNAIVVDVRLSPRSRVTTWRQGNLVNKLTAERYIHVGELGNVNFRGGPMKIKDINTGTVKVQAILDAGFSVILMCACKDVEWCHRTPVSEHVADVTGLELIHITADWVDPNAEPKPVQPSLF